MDAARAGRVRCRSNLRRFCWPDKCSSERVSIITARLQRTWRNSYLIRVEVLGGASNLVREAKTVCVLAEQPDHSRLPLRALSQTYVDG